MIDLSREGARKLWANSPSLLPGRLSFEDLLPSQLSLITSRVKTRHIWKVYSASRWLPTRQEKQRPPLGGGGQSVGKAKAQSLPGSCQEEGASVSPAGQPLLAPSGSFPYPIALPKCPWIDQKSFK